MMPKPVGKLDKAALIILCILVLPVAWFALILAPIMTEDVSLMGVLDGMNAAMAQPFNIQWVEASPKYLFLFVGLYATCVMAWAVTRRRTRPLEEYGSAQWGDVRQITKKYASQESSANLLMTQNFRLGLDSHKHRRNLNVLVVGGSGAGKTRFYAKPNILQGNTSFVVTDPNGYNIPR